MHNQERITSQRELTDLIKARYPLLYIVTFEEARVEKLIKDACRDREMRLEIWSVTEGFKTVFGGQGKRDIFDPLKALDTSPPARGAACPAARLHPSLKAQVGASCAPQRRARQAQKNLISFRPSTIPRARKNSR